MPRLLYAVAEGADGRRGYEEIAEHVSRASGRGVSADDVRTLVEKKLRPIGVLAQADGSSPRLEKSDPLLALNFRTAIVPAWLTKALTTVFYPFFYPPVVVAALAGIVAVDIWLFLFHGVAQSTRELLYNPVLLLLVLGLVVLATALHEIGHATACRYGGAEPGVMGAGIYVVWPAFYTDVTDAYRLGRGGRLRTDLGGVYFNGLFVLAIAGAYALTGFEPLLVLVVIQHFQVLQQLLPFLRLDGYYILSDLTGVPDLFARIKPTLKSVLPGKSPDEEVEQLKPWVRVATTAWVLALVPVLLFVFGVLAFNAPRLFATAYDSFFVQKDKAANALGDGRVLAGLAGIVQTVGLILPLAGMTYSFGRVSTKVVHGGWRWSRGAPLRRALIVTTTACAAAVAAYVLLPNGDYRPIQQNEQGTLQGGVRQFGDLATGRPGLTERRERELGGIQARRRKAESEEDAGEPRSDSGTTPPKTSSVTTGTATSPEPTGTTTAVTTTEAGESTETARTSTTETTTATATTTTGTTETTETTETTP